MLAQTYADFELIVVDDGSTDGSGDIVSKIRDPRIRLIRQENAGPSAARNRGVEEAGSDLIAFLDADDEWFEDFLDTVLTLREKFPQAAVWGTAYVTMDSDGQLTSLQLDSSVLGETDGLILNYFETAVRGQPFNASSIMVRKEALQRIGGFTANLLLLEDTDTLLRLALRFPLAYTRVAKAIYHKEAENRSNQWLYSGSFPFFESTRAFLRECGENCEMSEEIKQYLALHHMRMLYHNWLSGDQVSMKQIIRDCRNIKGYRLRCFLWRLIVWIPNPIVIFSWTLLSRLRGRGGRLPNVRSIYRRQ